MDVGSCDEVKLRAWRGEVDAGKGYRCHVLGSVIRGLLLLHYEAQDFLRRKKVRGINCYFSFISSTI